MNIRGAAVKANIHLHPGHLYFDPEWLVLGVNNACNLHCVMCDVGTGYTASNFSANLIGSHPLNMPLELIKTIVDQAAAYFPRVKLGYAFTEPLIYPHLIESIAYATSRGLYTSITTNALTLPSSGEALANAGLKDIFISLDGPEEIHNRIRGNAKSFQQAVRGIEMLAALPTRPDISIFCVINEWNIGHLRRFAEFFSRYPIKHLGFMHENFTTQRMANAHNEKYASRYPATVSTREESNEGRINISALWDEIRGIKNLALPFSEAFSPELKSMEDLHDYYFVPERRFGNRCTDVFRNIMIKSDGSVIPAHGRCYNLTIGNLYENDLRAIWNSKIAGQFRKDLMRAGGLFEACSRCCSAFQL